MAEFMASKDPNNIEPYFVVWCDPHGSNFSGDDGELQGSLITGSAWIMPTGTLVRNSSNTNAVTIAGIAYSINTVSTIWLSSGTAGQNYTLTNRIGTNDGRTLDWSLIIPVVDH
jgi:hypothetical protein